MKAVSDNKTINWQKEYWDNLVYLLGKPKATAAFKTIAEDFIVEEKLGFPLAGFGEHFCFYIEKKNKNTQQLIQSIAKECHIQRKDIGYCGLKDKQSQSSQWLSLPLKKNSAEDYVNKIEQLGVTVKEFKLNNRKLKIGSHLGNQFTLRLRNVTLIDEVLERFNLLKKQGMPNYFALQRFGYQFSNLKQALIYENSQWQLKREFSSSTNNLRYSRKNKILISAVRSWLFNQILSDRIIKGAWAKPELADVLQLDGSKATFKACQEKSERLLERLINKDVHIALPMLGDVKGIDLDHLSQQVVDGHKVLIAQLSALQLKTNYRAMRVDIKDASYKQQEKSLQLAFFLPVGAYATALLREIVEL